MTPHNHTRYVEGCYRCELSRDEARNQVIDRLAEAMVEEGWLQPDWDASTHYCDKCKRPSGADGDGGENVRGQLRFFLERALGEGNF